MENVKHNHRGEYLVSLSHGPSRLSLDNGKTALFFTQTLPEAKGKVKDVSERFLNSAGGSPNIDRHKSERQSDQLNSRKVPRKLYSTEKKVLIKYDTVSLDYRCEDEIKVLLY
jgi:hypothetical protein